MTLKAARHEAQLQREPAQTCLDDMQPEAAHHDIDNITTPATNNSQSVLCTIGAPLEDTQGRQARQGGVHAHAHVQSRSQSASPHHVPTAARSCADMHQDGTCSF